MTGEWENPDACHPSRTTADHPQIPSFFLRRSDQPCPCIPIPSTDSTLTASPDAARGYGHGSILSLSFPDFLVLPQPTRAALSQAGGEHAKGEDHASSGKEQVSHVARLHPV